MYCSHLRCPLGTGSSASSTTAHSVPAAFSAANGRSICSPMQCLSEAGRRALAPAMTCRMGNSLPACKGSAGHLQGCWQLGKSDVRCPLEQEREGVDKRWKSKQLHKSWGCNFLQATHIDFPNSKMHQNCAEERKQKICAKCHQLFLILFFRSISYYFDF